ncbi:DNA polymerase [Ruficoccus amylovorans]|uniref:DNA polymerase n=1 Tax=Ruficoccus amylovorans TaxID=1804625 RepID=A0A842HFN7_9BACT|nr:DNA polymerase [Ruficoccus amylovorans]MBC2594101.1 DNA polymerase [Ruficoccus amylovorans]
MPLRYVFVDLDSYFASCEQQLQPRLRGRPVGVVPSLNEGTCCIAASYEAKACGVKTGTGVREARFLCPQIELVESHPREYVEIHHRIKDAVERHLHVIEARSIDEMYGELPSHHRNETDARRIVEAIRADIAANVGASLTCSFGIGPNILLSKVASGMNKPSGTTFIHDHSWPECFSTLELRDWYGIGRNMERRLAAHGIRSIAQLYAASCRELRKIWGGIEGERLFAELRGAEVERPPTRRRHLSHSHILPPRKRTRSGAFAVINRLTQKAATRLRHEGYFAATLEMGVRYDFSTKWTAETHFFETQETAVFLKMLRKLWDSMPAGLGDPTQVWVVLGGLVDAEHDAPPLFADWRDERRLRLDQTMDALNRRYGTRCLYYAAAHKGRSEAPMRISFTHVPDLEVERD